MKTSTLIIILLVVMNLVTLNIALSNRDAIVSTFIMLDNLSSTYKIEDK